VKKIFHLITSLGGGGTENFLVQILTASPTSFHHEVVYLKQDGVNGERIRRLGIPVARAGSIATLYRRLKTTPPDILHTCLYRSHQIGRIIGRLAGVPFIISSQQSIDLWQKPWHRWIDQRTLPLCDVVDYNSEAARTLVEKRLGTASERPRLVPIENGVDFNDFTPIDRLKARQPLALAADAVVGGTLMRLHAEKGADKIPAFARMLLNANPRLILLVAGTGPQEIALKEETREMGDRLRWVGWQEDPVPFLSALDFFWLPSREESFPQSLLEASAMGLPWLAPDVGGIRELARNGACGLLSENGSAGALATTGKTLLTELSARTEKARQAVATLRPRYGVEKMTTAFYRIFEENSL